MAARPAPLAWNVRIARASSASSVAENVRIQSPGRGAKSAPRQTEGPASGPTGMLGFFIAQEYREQDDEAIFRCAVLALRVQRRARPGISIQADHVRDRVRGGWRLRPLGSKHRAAR